MAQEPLVDKDLHAKQPRSFLQQICGGSQIILWTLLLLLCAIGNRVAFKLSGYELGRKPFAMIFLTVLGSIPINALSYLYMLCRTGGVLPEFRTGKIFYNYWVIATLNIFNGLGIMWANPFVSGYVQCLLSSMAIPMTMALSALVFRSRFSLLSVSGVVLIVLGVLYVGAGQQQATGEGSSMLWTCVYAAAQFPLAGTSVYQEHAFKKSLNMLHYIHYVTLFLMLDLIVCVPINILVGGTPSLQAFMQDLGDQWQCIRGSTPECEGTGIHFFIYIVAMNGGTLVQALLIKMVSAAWVMVLLSLATPLTVLAFACPFIVGRDHFEPLTASAFISAGLITCGTLIYRVGSIPRTAVTTVSEEEPEPSEASSPRPFHHKAVQTDLSLGVKRHRAMQLLELLLEQEEASDRAAVPAVVAAGVGLFPSEYTNAQKNSLSLWEERTLAERRQDCTQPLLPEKSQDEGCFQFHRAGVP